jgi:hypothetical protein
LICKGEFVNWSGREDREGTCACKLHQEKRSRACTKTEPAGDGFRVAGKYTTWWMGCMQDLRATTVLENRFVGQNTQETRTFSCNKIWQGLHQEMVEILHPVC